jgi:type I restriction enzyme S subunit
MSTSATIGEYAVVSEEHIANQRFVSLNAKPDFVAEVSASFLPHLAWIISKFCIENATDSGNFPSISNQKLASALVPIPNLAVQNEVANLLDRFDALVNDISIGLPGEIEARRKQYEYYRDKLLTFPEAAA